MAVESSDTVGGPRVGEVVEASTSRFVVQCHELYGAPPLGSLVRSEGGVYGVVAEVTTQSLDPGRRAVAMGRGEESAEAVYRRHPQLTRLMSTELEAVVVAHRSGGELSRFLAPTPPRIHEIVHACGDPELLEVAGELELLPSLLASPAGSPDDVTAAFLRQVVQAHPEPERVRLEAGRKLAGHLAGQLHRLTGILRRVASG